MIGRWGGFWGRLSDEQHRSEHLAARWHRVHAGLYVGLILAYGLSSLWHLAAARRHDRAARQSAPKGRL